jgi:hypothetical protein
MTITIRLLPQSTQYGVRIKGTGPYYPNHEGFLPVCGSCALRRSV